jgi:hypothetical protein
MYRAVAEMVRDCHSKTELRDRLADYFESQNPKFDRIRFIEACEGRHRQYRLLKV